MKIHTPFNDLQVERLKKYQDNPNWHPYTCHNGHKLIPERGGLKCYACEYTQTWCHDFSVRLSTVDYAGTNT